MAKSLICWLMGLGLAVGAAEVPLPPASSPKAARTNLLQGIGTDGKRGPVRSTEDWQRRRGEILTNMQAVMGPVPSHWRNLPLEVLTTEEATLPSVIRKRITYRVEPADRLSAWLLTPRGLKGKAPAVLCLHQTVEIGKDEPAGLGGSPELHYARELAERGFVTLCPDYWTFGDYRQQPYDPYEHGYVSGTMKGIWNHIRSLDLLQSLPEVDGLRLACMGHSLGGHNALWLAAFDERVKVAVSSCGFNSFASYAASPYGGGTLKNYAQRRYMPRIASEYGNDAARLPFEWSEVLAAIAPRPVFINAPIHDANFVVEGVRQSVDSARPVFAWMGAETNLVVTHPDAGHTFPLQVRQQAYDFIGRALRAGHSGRGGGNGKQPATSDPNRTSAEATSRRSP